MKNILSDYELVAKIKLTCFFILALVAALFLTIATIHHHSKTQKYEQICTKLQEENYKLYINGEEVDANKVDINLYLYSDISFNDDQKAVYIEINR